MDGILLINKEPNMTSRDVVNKVCHLLNTKKVGHTGTLDPMATGVLVLAINKGLKIVNEITALDKEYEAEITLGIDTDTLDITGKTVSTKEVNVTNEDIDRVLKTFIGEYDMEVPKYSAIKVNGKKLYEYARNNEDVKVPIHKVKVYELVRTSDIKDNKFTIKCKVSKGTYIRSLVRDISKELGTVGVMSKLNRTKQGNFELKDCYTLKDLEDGNYKLLDIKDVLDLPVVEVPDSIYNKVINGNKIDNTFDYDKFIFEKDNKVIAIYEKENDLLRPLHMFI
jgi:tRNA pseudouridine55 synthase